MFISDSSGISGVSLDSFPMDPGPYMQPATLDEYYRINQSAMQAEADRFSRQIIEERQRLEDADRLDIRWRFRIMQAINKLSVRLRLKKAPEQELLQPLLSSREP